MVVGPVSVSVFDRWPFVAVQEAGSAVLLAAVSVLDGGPVVAVQLVIDEVAAQRLDVPWGVRSSDLAD